MQEYVAVQTALDLWPEVKDFYLHVFCPSGFIERINVDLETLEGYFLASLLPSQQGTPDFGLIVIKHGQQNRIVGIAVLEQHIELVKFRYVPRTFVRGVFIKSGLGYGPGEVMDEAICAWARARGHDMVYGYVRKGFCHRAVLERYGWRHLYDVSGKMIDRSEC